MTCKISYPNLWDKDGYHYNQMVTLTGTYGEFVRANVALADNVRGTYFEDECKYDKRQKVFFFNLKENAAIAKYFGYDKDKRFLDRNTCVRTIVDFYPTGK